MGLLRFGKSRRNDAWARASAPELDGEKDADGKRCEFNDSFMSQGTWETVGVTVATDDSSSDSAGAAKKIRSLQRRLRQKAVAMARLREAAEAGERVQSERIELLERQLELLVELPPSGRRKQGRALLDPNKSGSTAQDDSRDDSQEDRRSQLEMSALQELLARVIAEKDRLGFENEHLRSLFKEGSGHPPVGQMPPSIVELDTRMILNEQEKEQKEKRREASPDLAPPAPLEELPLVLYKMTCRDRPQGQSRLRYMGNYTPTGSDSVKELTRRMKAHYSQVWRMVLEAKGDIALISSEDEGEDGDGFRTSSLAKHCVEHCLMQCLSSEEEVVRWCTDNVRVEIQKKERKAKSVPPGERKKKERKVKSVPPQEKEGKDRKAKSVPPREKDGKERKAKSVPPREKEGRRRKKNRAGKSGKEDEKAKKGCSCEI